MRHVQFKCEAKEDVAELLLQFADKGPFHNLLQLISNTWDAIAHGTWVDYYPNSTPSKLSVKDNGEGMNSVEGLPEFWWYGKSPKKQNKMKCGRRMMGDRGIAVIAIAAMCEELYLETIRDGRKTVFHRDFSKGLTLGEIVDGGEEEVDPKTPSGTLIEMRNLKFQPGDEFNEIYLKRWIPWKRPILPDFKIYVNDEELLARSVQNSKMKVRIDEKGNHMGRVFGHINITGTPAPEAGIYVYVHGECIGTTVDYYEWDNLPLELAKRMVVTVDADDLRTAEGADRYTFIKGNRGYEELKGYLGREIDKARTTYDKESQYTRASAITNQMPVLLRQVSERLATKAVAGYRKLQETEGKKGRTLKPETAFTEMDESLPGVYKDGAIMINSNDPALRVTSNSSAAALKHNIAEDMVLILAANGAISVKDLLARRARIWADINSEGKLENRQIRPELVYGLEMLAELSERTVGELKHFAATGLFPCTDEGVCGADYLKFAKSILGYTSLYSSIADRMSQADIPIYMERYGNLIKIAGEKVTEHLIKNLGQTIECYALANVCQESVFGLLHGLENQNSDVGIRDTFKTFRSRMLSVPDIALECDGIDEKHVTRVIEYTGKQNIHLGYSRTPKGTLYHFGDFVRAHLDMLSKTASEFNLP